MPDHLQLIVFSLDERCYALRLETVEKTTRLVEITPLPTSPEMVIGVINVHGSIVPVLNIRKRFRLPERELRLGDQLIIARTSRRRVALLVDSVSDVVALPPDCLAEPSGILPRLEYVEGVAILDAGMIFIHDLDSFLSLEEEQTLESALECNLRIGLHQRNA